MYFIMMVPKSKAKFMYEFRKHNELEKYEFLKFLPNTRFCLSDDEKYGDILSIKYVKYDVMI